jgi:hypothetical protein
MLSLPAPPIVDKVRRKLRRHGFPAALYGYGMRAVNMAVSLRILRALYLAQPDPQFRQCPPGYTVGFASHEMLRRAAAQTASDLSPEFVSQALARGDQCFALRDGESLVAYSWYSFRPTPIGLPGALVHFDPCWVYRYKDYTHPRYRGRRLHALVATLGLEHYLARGFRGSVAYVESTNFDSLKSCFRYGHRAFGSIGVLQAFGRTFTLATPGCERMGFRLETYPLGPFVPP